MVRRCSDRMAKLLMIVFNGVFLACGIAILAIGFMDIKNFNSVQRIIEGLTEVNVAFIVVGAIVCIISFLGCCGALRESSCMITTFLALLTIILISEIVVGGIAFTKRDEIGDLVKSEAKASLNKTRNNEIIGKAWDDVQTSFVCCGADSYNDYAQAGLEIRPSCCKTKLNDGEKCAPNRSDFSKDPCIKKIENFLRRHFLSIGVTAIMIAFIEVVGIIFACCLRGAINERYETV